MAVGGLQRQVGMHQEAERPREGGSRVRIEGGSTEGWARPRVCESCGVLRGVCVWTTCRAELLACGCRLWAVGACGLWAGRMLVHRRRVLLLESEPHAG